MLLKSQQNKFNDDFESVYREYYLLTDVRYTCLAIAIWLIPVLFFGYTDYLIFGYGNQFIVLLATRLFFFVISLYTVFILLKVSTVKQYDLIFLCWAFVTTIFILFINYKWAPYAPPNGEITILILFSAYMISPNRFYVRIIPPIILSIGNLILQWYFTDFASNSATHTMFVAIVMANVLGLILSGSLEKHRRAEFRALMEEARIKEHLHRLASVDSLTGIVNRRQLVQLAEEQFKRFKNTGEIFSILMMDIDYFKKINDTYGHVVGDEILKQFSTYVENNLEENKIWGRFGGDEFVLILRKVSSEESKKIAEKLKLGINSDTIQCHGEEINYTISVGITEVKHSDSSFEEVLKRADEALYDVKRNGRGSITVL